MLTPGADPVRKVSIIPRGMALGVDALRRPRTTASTTPRTSCGRKIQVSLGGRVAEELVFGETTTGAESDIQQVTRIARGMVEPLGDEREGGLPRRGARETAASPLLPGAEPVSEATQELMDAEVRRIVDDEPRSDPGAARRATATSSTRSPQALLERETLDEVDAYAAAGIERGRALSRS